MNKTIDLVIRITVPVAGDPAEHCLEAFEREDPLLAVSRQLASHTQALLLAMAYDAGGNPAANVQRVRLTLEPGREPGRPMTRAEAELFRAGVAAGMALTMDASGLHEVDQGLLTEMECLLADYTGMDYEDYAEDDAALRLLRLIRCEWTGSYWQTMTPGNEPARQATLAAPKPWDHALPWGE